MVLYLTFLRYAAIFFLSVTVMDMMVLLPTFMYGEGRAATALERITFINVIGQYYSTWIVFLFTVLVSMMAHIFIYFFEEKRRALAIKREKEAIIHEEDTAFHTVLVRGIDRDLSIEQAKGYIHSVFKTLLEEDLIQTHVIADYQ
jgi:hypothetical protein